MRSTDVAFTVSILLMIIIVTDPITPPKGFNTPSNNVRIFPRTERAKTLKETCTELD